MNEFKKLLSNLYQLPQHILGFLLQACYKGTVIRNGCGKAIAYPNKADDDNDVLVIDTTRTKIKKCDKFPGGISLGEFIIVSSEDSLRNGVSTLDRRVAHEYGHTIDSRKSGPLYLLWIGLPSIGWNMARAMFPKLNKKSYFSFYAEKRADANVGIKR